MLLVLAGWWTRWMYAVGVLKALEERNMKSVITHIYGVSIGAIVWVLWSNWLSADEIYDELVELFHHSFVKTLGGTVHGLTSAKKHARLIDMYEHIPERFEELAIPVTICATDIYTHGYEIYDSGPLYAPLQWSMAVPGVFQPVEYDGKLLVDGGVLNAYPTRLAVDTHPWVHSLWVWYVSTPNTSKPLHVGDVVKRTETIRRMGWVYQWVGVTDYELLYRCPYMQGDVRQKTLRDSFERGYVDWLGLEMA